MRYKKVPKVIAVTGGKGGVGKTVVAVNLALALTQLHKKVLLIDTDTGLANVDIMLGMRAERNVSHVFSGECTVSEVLIKSVNDLYVLPAAMGVKDMTKLGHREVANFIQSLSREQYDFDMLVVDTAAGISEAVLGFSGAAHEVIVVICNEPTSIADAYAIIKLLHHDYGICRFRILVNRVKTTAEGEAVLSDLIAVTDRFLNVSLQLMGTVPDDVCVGKAVRRQQPLLDIYPTAKASVAFQALGRKVIQWSLPIPVRGQSQFYFEQLIHDTVVSKGA